MSQPELPQRTAIFGLAQSTNVELVWDLHAKTQTRSIQNRQWLIGTGH